MVRLLIKVKPGASRDEISLDIENNMTVRIKAKAIEGEANDYLVKFLAEEFNISRSRICIEKGVASRFKRIAIDIGPLKMEEILIRYKP